MLERGLTVDHTTVYRWVRFLCSRTGQAMQTILETNQYLPAIGSLIEDQTLPETTQLRTVKYLNNIVEQDHRFIKRRVNPGMGNVAHLTSARRTLRGYEAMNFSFHIG